MTNGRPSADTEVMVPHAVPEAHRGRVSVRRRRSRPGHDRSSGKWVAARSRRRAVRAFALSAGVLLLMAIGLYFGLSRQNAAPAEGAARIGVLGAAGLV